MASRKLSSAQIKTREDLFTPRVMGFLEAHKLIHNVALTSITNLKSDPSLPFAATAIYDADHSDNLIGLTICYNYFGNVYYTFASSPEFSSSATTKDFDDFAEIVAEDICSSPFSLKSFNVSDAKFSKHIIEKINNRKNYSKKAKLFMDMNLFQLLPSNLKRSYLELPPGHTFRLADEKDIDTVADYTIEFLKELNMAENSTDRTKLKAMAQDLIKRQQRFLIFDSSANPASFGGIRIILPRIYSVGPIYTPKEYRKKGLATAITANICAQLFDNDRADELSIFADAANATTNHIYPLVGFKIIWKSSNIHLIDDLS